jgi:hypothetical protein
LTLFEAFDCRIGEKAAGKGILSAGAGASSQSRFSVYVEGLVEEG